MSPPRRRRPAASAAVPRHVPWRRVSDGAGRMSRRRRSNPRGDRRRATAVAGLLDPVLLEDGPGVHQLVDLGVVEAVLVHDLAGVLATDGRGPPDALGCPGEMDRLAEVL